MRLIMCNSRLRTRTPEEEFRRRGRECRLIYFLQLNAATCTQAGASLLDAAQKTAIVFEPVIEPVIFGLEADQHPAGLPCRVMTISLFSASRR